MKDNVLRKVLIFGIITLLILGSSPIFINGRKASINSYDLLAKTGNSSNGFLTPSYVDSSNGLPTIGQWPYATRVGDVNEDGYLDIIRLRGHDDFNVEDQGFQIWLGDGTGGWSKTSIPNGNFGYGGTAVGDFNNDGYLDAAYGVHHNRAHPLIGAWAGDGGTSFTECSTGLATDGETYGMAPIDFGDFNNDGYLDIGVGSFGGGNGIRAYENINGGESWVSKSTGLPHNADVPNVGNWLIWDDINRDGLLDIVISTEIVSSGEEHVIWLGDGTGSWTANDFELPFEYGWGAHGLDVGDVNNDGWLDITFIEHMEEGNDDWYVPVVYTFNGNGWTDASDGLPNPPDCPEITFLPLAFGDLDNDGYLDLVGLESTGIIGNTDIHAWLGDGTGHWTEINEIATNIPGDPQSVTLADIDHNNYLDIITSSDRDDYDPGGIRVYKETTSKSQLKIRMRRPVGGEVFVRGGIRKITWTSSIPSGTATVRLQYSTTGDQGPWHTIVSGLTDANYYQWTVPNVCTSNGFIKATVNWNSQSRSAITARPFTILDASGNFPPYASFTFNVEDNTVFFNASSSYDRDGYIVSYEWIFGDGSTGTGVIVNHTYSDYGTYVVRLTVTDNDGLTGTTPSSILIEDKIPPMIGEIHVKPLCQIHDGHVNVSAEVTDNVEITDVHLIITYPDDHIEEFSIKQNRTDDTYYCNKTYAQIGEYECSMWAIDSGENTATSSSDGFFEIEEDLIVNANGPYNGFVNDTIQFYGSASGGIPQYTWRWDFGDGNSSDMQNPTYVYTQARNYTAILTVTDSKGNVGNDTATVAIIENEPPIIQIAKPEKALYINNKKIIPFFTSLIIGSIDIEVNASDESGVNRIEFYIDSVLKEIVTTEPFGWTWDEKTFGRHAITVKAYDNAGNPASNEMTVWKFF